MKTTCNRISGSTRSIFFPDNILTKVDHTSMAHAIEVSAAVPGPPHCGVREFASREHENSGLPPEGDPAGSDDAANSGPQS